MLVVGGVQEGVVDSAVAEGGMPEKQLSENQLKVPTVSYGST